MEFIDRNYGPGPAGDEQPSMFQLQHQLPQPVNAETKFPG